MSLPQVVEPKREHNVALNQEVEQFLGDASLAFNLEQAELHQRELINQIKSDFSWQTPEQFGDQEARGVSSFADTIIKGVKSSSMGSAHNHLSELRMITKRLGNKMEPQGIIGKLFFNGRKALEQFSSDWDTVDGQISHVVATLERDRRESLVSIESLRRLREESLHNFRRMAAAIIAGREILAEERLRLEDIRNTINNDDSGVQAAEFRQLEQNVDIFDRRLTNLEKSRSISAGMIPSVQQTLRSEIIVSEELDMALTQAIPLMKQQMALVVEQVRQEERLASLAATRDATDSMMDDIATRLKTNQEKVDEQVREGIASADKVVEFLERIGTTIEEIDQRQSQAQSDRMVAREKMEEAVLNLKNQLIQKPAG